MPRSISWIYAMKISSCRFHNSNNAFIECCSRFVLPPMRPDFDSWSPHHPLTAPIVILCIEFRINPYWVQCRWFPPVHEVPFVQFLFFLAVPSTFHARRRRFAVLGVEPPWPASNILLQEKQGLQDRRLRIQARHWSRWVDVKSSIYPVMSVVLDGPRPLTIS